MSAWDDENRWYARLMKLAHELAMDDVALIGERAVVVAVVVGWIALMVLL